ncbi:protein neprosin-like [Humulus lupulus]|uniref:protein neprosin-like n=1 Tax=Humulus lupulus TaxID=3486 RepID=UPI002B412573|nr:protein neprosin-like [Humulus lupulus]
MVDLNKAAVQGIFKERDPTILLPNHSDDISSHLTSDIGDGRKLHSSELGKRKGTIKTIESDDGDVIDCVDIYKQPAFDHPLLKNHTIEYAEVTMLGGPYFGAKSNINVWNPDSHGTMSVSQIWVASSSNNYDQLNTIEAGWIAGNGDPRTRFFIYWTRDGYKDTGCYDLDCPGFIQVSRTAAIGSILDPISSYNGKQAFINVDINQDTENGEWWLRFQNKAIGYWPNTIFKTLGNGADLLSWGGEIVNDGAKGHHSETQMGSGHFPDEGYGKASYFSNIMYMDDSKSYKDPEKLTAYATKPSCYDIKVAIDKTTNGTHFFYGGPGYSDKCPT